MTPNEMVHRIATYIIAPHGDPVAHVQRQMYQLYTDGITSFTLEDGGILTLNYDEGNYPTIQLSDWAEIEINVRFTPNLGTPNPLRMSRVNQSINPTAEQAAEVIKLFDILNLILV